MLKPDWMRSPGASLPERAPRHLRVTVYSAYIYQGRSLFVMKDDPFVQVCAGVHAGGG